MSKKKLGPWSETFDTRHRVGYYRRGGNTAPWIALNFDVGLYSNRTGVINGGPPYFNVSPATLSRQTAIMTAPSYIKVRTSAKTWDELKEGLLTSQYYDPFRATPYTISTNATKDLVKQRVRDKLSAIWDVGISIGEAKESRDMIVNACNDIIVGHNKATQSLSKDIKVFLRSPRKTVLSYAKMIADNVLAYSFGISPLIGEVQSAAQSIAALKTNFIEKRPISGTGKSGIAGSYSRSYEAPIGGIYGWYKQHEYLSERFWFKAGGNYVSLSLSGQPDIRQLFGLDPSDPVSFLKTAYEVFPYSWLWDYFSNLGDFVSALSFSDRLLRNNFEVQLFERELKIVSHKIRTDPQYTIETFNGAATTYRFFTFLRQTTSFSTLPSNLRFQVPGISQAINVISLGASRAINPLPMVRQHYGPETSGLVHNLLSK